MQDQAETVAQRAAAHRSGARKVTDTIGQTLERAQAVQRAFNAFASLDADAHIAAGAESGPLAGVAISVKDILDVAGLPTRWGSPLFAEAALAKTDMAAVARLKAAGAVVIGKTTTTEFAHSPLGSSPLTGMTLNPWNPALTCGGSSAGAGTSIAVGATRVALATDAGCSTRLPAACTGVYGLKPTLSLIPHERVPDGFGSFIHLGLLGRSVADIAAVLPVVAGPQPNDPWSLRPPAATPVAADAPLAGKTVLLWMRTGNRMVSREVEAATRRASAILEELGADVREADYGFAHPDPIWKTLQQTNWALRFASSSETELARLSPTLLAGIEEAKGYSGLDLQRAQVARTQLFRAVQGVFAGVDFILTPCTSAAPVAADFDLSGPLMVDGAEAGDLRSEWTAALSLFDLTGHPAIALPVGLGDNGGPVAVQLVAPWHGDMALLGAAAAFEARVPPPVWAGAV
ncbi:amidase [Aquabacter sp. CN5-332]|uniref:amidase n=1 Tax=Aquabacter sp. CN5-332 TaxID=3156608 RepID=UPI0032B4BB34